MILRSTERSVSNALERWLMPPLFTRICNPPAFSITFGAKVIEKAGGLHILVNNGGISQRSNAFDTDLSVDRRIMEINYFGNVALTKAVLPHFREQENGNFIVLSSVTGKFGFYLRSAYAASKHALHGFYESLRLEEEEHGIMATLVCPGRVVTNISINSVTQDGSSYGKMDPGQAAGMPVDECARQIIEAMQEGREEVTIGSIKERLGVWMKRHFPKIFGQMIRGSSPT